MGKAGGLSIREKLDRLEKRFHALNKQHLLLKEELIYRMKRIEKMNTTITPTKSKTFHTIGVGDIVIPGPDMPRRIPYARRTNPNEPGRVIDKNHSIHLVQWSSGEQFWYRYERKFQSIQLYNDVENS